jgi:hypothetical protein
MAETISDRSWRATFSQCHGASGSHPDWPCAHLNGARNRLGAGAAKKLQMLITQRCHARTSTGRASPHVADVILLPL